jgi:DNA polymerase-3 subunit gamma/tau
MLTSQAFNALLKTLEEPPPHVKFIFATTEPQKILSTVISRCQRFDLGRIPTPLIVDRLAEIAKAEKVDISPDALLAMARGAEGGLRDAESALDQIISFKGDRITEEDVLSVFGLASRGALETIVNGILTGDVSGLMQIVAELDESGRDIRRLVVDLLACFRNLLLCAHAKGAACSFELTGPELETARKQAVMTSPERLLKIADTLIETDYRIKNALSRRTLLEITLIRCARTATVVSIDEILNEIDKLKRALGADAPIQEKNAPMPAGSQESGHPPSPAAGAVSAVRNGSAVVAKENGGPQYEAAKATLPELLRARWREVVSRVEAAAPMARSALLDASPLSVEDGVVVIGFDSEFAEHMKRMESPQNTAITKSVLKAVLGRDVEIRFQLMQGRGKPDLPADTRPGPPKAGETKIEAEGKKQGSKQTGTGRSVSELMRNDAIRKTVEAFGGEIVDVRE